MKKWIPLFTVSAMALFPGACQRQPLPGQEPMHAHGTEHHEDAEPDEKAAEEAHAETKEEPHSSSGETAPKFFPESK